MLEDFPGTIPGQFEFAVFFQSLDRHIGSGQPQRTAPVAAVFSIEIGIVPGEREQRQRTAEPFRRHRESDHPADLFRRRDSGQHRPE